MFVFPFRYLAVGKGMKAFGKSGRYGEEIVKIDVIKSLF